MKTTAATVSRVIPSLHFAGCPECYRWHYGNAQHERAATAHVAAHRADAVEACRQLFATGNAELFYRGAVLVSDLFGLRHSGAGNLRAVAMTLHYPDGDGFTFAMAAPRVMALLDTLALDVKRWEAARGIRGATEQRLAA